MCHKYNISKSVLWSWVRKYEENGIEGLNSKTGKSKYTNPHAGLHLRKPKNRIEELELELMKKEIEIARLKKSYMVKGVGAEKESLQDKVRDYVTCTFKRDSKLAKIIKHIGYEQMDLDYIASIVYEFLYSIKIDFATGTSILAGTRIDLEKMPFTNKEKELSEDEKMSTIIKIISAFDIECVYIEELNKISDFLLGCIFGEISREDAINFSEHNYNILNNSEFSPIYRKIISLNQKQLIKDKN